MSQNSLTLPTSGLVSGLQMTQATNQALDTLNTLASGAGAPSAPEAGQFWHDTTLNIINLRSLDNTTWIPLIYLNESSYSAVPSSYGQLNASLNRLVNGEFFVDQTNEGISFSVPHGANTYGPDMWQLEYSGPTGGAAITAQSISDAPIGFYRSLKVTVGTAQGPVVGTDLLWIFQQIEGFSVADLNYGTASAQPISLSFWVKASLAGTYTAFLFPSISSANRGYIMPFTIATPGTWQQVQFQNIPGDMGGTYGSGTSVGLSLGISVTSGPSYQDTAFTWVNGGHTTTSGAITTPLTTSGATFQITGVMMNAGAFCAPFEKKKAGAYLIDCQRYYEKSYDSGVTLGTSTFLGGEVHTAGFTGAWDFSARYKVTKRVDPTLTVYSATTGLTGKVYNASTSSDVTITGSSSGQNAGYVYWTSVAGQVYAAHFTADARF